MEAGTGWGRGERSEGTPRERQAPLGALGMGAASRAAPSRCEFCAHSRDRPIQRPAQGPPTARFPLSARPRGEGDVGGHLCLPYPAPNHWG